MNDQERRDDKEQQRYESPVVNTAESASTAENTTAVEGTGVDTRLIDISVCIVTYKARELLRECLDSLYEATRLRFETIVVDNGSNDGVGEMLKKDFPDITFVQNTRNEGYTSPMNQALRLGKGRYLLQLNPDTLILPEALERLVKFMDETPQVGICGPKVLNRDMSLQKPCRRGEPTPWAVISYFTGLAALFPKSPFFGRYLVSYLDENQRHPVDGVSGSCMLIRKELCDQIGFLDEMFFAYQEDADYCRRARQANWQVYYVPEAQIIHYGGMGGSMVEPYRSLLAWHKSYFLYYHKHLAKNYFFLFNWFYYLIMGVKLVYSLAINVFRQKKSVGSRKP
jgi:GT2 family glycosyltransferase